MLNSGAGFIGVDAWYVIVFEVWEQSGDCLCGACGCADEVGSVSSLGFSFVGEVVGWH